MTARSTSCRRGGSTPGRASDRPHPRQVSCERLEHAHRQQLAGVEERRPRTVLRHRPREGDVLHEVTGHGRQPTLGEERFAAHRPCTARSPSCGPAVRGRRRAGRTGTRAWSASPRAATATAPSGTRTDRRPSGGRGARPRRAPRARSARRRVGAGVGVEGDDPVGGGGQQTLLQRPRLAGPSGRQRGRRARPGHRGRAERSAVASVDPSSTTITSATPGAPTMQVEQRADPVGLVARRDHDRC